MPFDGLCTYAITKELQHKLVGKKIYKVYQPVKDELVLYFSDREKVFCYFAQTLLSLEFT